MEDVFGFVVGVVIFLAFCWVVATVWEWLTGSEPPPPPPPPLPPDYIRTLVNKPTYSVARVTRVRTGTVGGRRVVRVEQETVVRRHD